MVKIKWKVQPAPTGRYRSFDRRSWPQAYYPDERLCAWIECEDEYRGYFNQSNGSDHKPLRIYIRKYDSQGQGSIAGFVRSKNQYSCYNAVKKVLPKILAAHPELMPTEYRSKPE